MNAGLSVLEPIKSVLMVEYDEFMDAYVGIVEGEGTLPESRVSRVLNAEGEGVNGVDTKVQVVRVVETDAGTEIGESDHWTTLPLIMYPLNVFV